MASGDLLTDPDPAEREQRRRDADARRRTEDRRAIPAALVSCVLMGASLVWVVGHPSDPAVGAFGGGAAVLVIGLLAGDYFWTPRRGQPIRAPNPWLRIPAGLAALYSAVLWIVDSLFP